MYSVADAYLREESILGRRSDEARANIHTEQLFLILFHIHNLCQSTFIYHYLNRHQQKLQCPDQLKKLEKMEGTLGLQGRQRRQRVKVLWILTWCQICASFNLNKTLSVATKVFSNISQAILFYIYRNVYISMCAGKGTNFEKSKQSMLFFLISYFRSMKISGETLCRDNCQLIGMPFFILARQAKIIAINQD